MGKNLHYSIRPFIEKALNNHFAVEKLEKIEIDDFYAYKITRRRGMSSLIVVLTLPCEFLDSHGVMGFILG